MHLRRHYRPGAIEIGVDEAGRGCLAGPVTAAAVLLWPGRHSPRDLNDSKQVFPERRDEMRTWIEANALAWSVGWASAQEIDTENILQATMTAMHRAVDGLRQNLLLQLEDPMIRDSLPGGFAERLMTTAPQPLSLLIDGHYFRPYPALKHVCLKKGDARFQSIAAASILAKTHRDALMRSLHVRHPQYAWDSNKGYGTPPHLRGIATHGPTEWHRRSFRGASG